LKRFSEARKAALEAIGKTVPRWRKKGGGISTGGKSLEGERSALEKNDFGGGKFRGGGKETRGGRYWKALRATACKGKLECLGARTQFGKIIT